MRDSIVMPRRRTRKIMVGDVPVGGDAPIAVQSMTNTLTTDIDATVAQVHSLEEAGADIVRISVPDAESAEAMPEILAQTNVPIIADIHFSYKMALLSLDAGVHGLRLNPGNIGSQDRVERVVKAAQEKGVSIRIGVNAGSLEKEFNEQYGEPCADAMVASALRHIRILEDMKFNVIEAVQELEARLAHIQEPLDVAVIGCVVNGPGEAQEVQVGITGGYPTHTFYHDGEKFGRVKSSNMIDALVEEVEKRAAVIREAKNKEAS